MRLLAKWRRHNGRIIRRPVDGVWDLTRPVAPGEAVEMSMTIRFHKHSTPLSLCVDMVDEGLGWFHDSGGRLARKLIVPRWFASTPKDQ